MEFDVGVPTKPLFYKSYLDDKCVCRKTNTRHKLFDELNSDHQNIKLTLAVNP